MAPMFEHDGEKNPNWDTYLKHGERMFVKRKAVIYHQGKTGKGFYVIHKGFVKICMTTVDGNERILDLSGPGQVVGEQALDGQPYFSSCIAADDTILYYFSTSKFRELVMSHPELLSLFVSSVIQKMRTLAEDVMLKKYNSEQQIAHILLKICYSFNNPHISLTQQELANFTGLTRITIYKVLKKWKEHKLIDVQNRKFMIKELDELKRYVNVS